LWVSGSRETIKNISNFLLSEKPEVHRLAGISFQIFQDGRIIIPQEVAAKLWEFSRNKQDFWSARYLKIMANCKLDWANNFDKWLEDIKNSQKDNHETEWCDIIERADYLKAKDRLALLSLLIQILEKHNTFSKKLNPQPCKDWRNMRLKRNQVLKSRL
jgi:hypothetical protein